MNDAVALEAAQSTLSSHGASIRPNGTVEAYSQIILVRVTVRMRRHVHIHRSTEPKPHHGMLPVADVVAKMDSHHSGAVVVRVLSVGTAVS